MLTSWLVTEVRSAEPPPAPGPAPTQPPPPPVPPMDAGPIPTTPPGPIPGTPPAPIPATPPGPVTPAPATELAKQPEGNFGTTPVVAEDGPAYPVTKLNIVYRRALPGVPSIEDVKSAVVVLGKAPDGFVSPMLPWEYRHLRPKLQIEPLRISEIGNPPYTSLHQSAVREICERIVQYFGDKGYLGIKVQPLATDLASREEANNLVVTDVREGRTDLTIEIVLAHVVGVRTIASGDRKEVQEPRINNPLHHWMIEQSPVREEGFATDTTLRKDKIDDYVLWLNQHPGRHVDLTISAADPQNEESVNVDYLVAESKPWMLYAQLSNTGTKQTNEWRERFGYTNNQFTNHDDIFTLDYVTAGFQDSNTVSGSYEAPFTRSSRTRYRVYGIYDEFTASDVGQSAQKFEGDQEQAGAELSFNIWQKREFFLYFVLGGRYERIYVNNQTSSQKGQANYFDPYISLRGEAVEEKSSLQSELTLVGGFTGASRDDLNALGRTNADADYELLQANLSYAFFLEPLFWPEEFRANRGVLAQEVALAFKGQYAFNNRLIPQAQETAGGFYSVRGYPESLSAGDSVIIANAEYRIHLPRWHAPDLNPIQNKYLGRFRMWPQQRYGRPDWDLIPKAFMDIGRTLNSDRLFFEHNDTLWGAGLGLEFQFKQNLNLQVDWGVALKGVDDPVQPVSAGSSRFHFSLTVLY